MNYYFESWTISKLLNLYQTNQLDLNPPYQRNDIWSLPAKKKLIQTIKEGFPLPSFFLYINKNGIFEMVDGQQRTRTFLGYVSGLFPDYERIYFKDSDKDFLLNKYNILIIIIKDVDDEKKVTEFYFKVNKFGTKLNRPEIIRSERFDNLIQKLIEDISASQVFKELELFSNDSLTRLLDQDFIGELLALIFFGITDKKDAVDKLFNEFDNNVENIDFLSGRFWEILFTIKDLNDYYPIKETRYKQRNDFYTLFSFILKHKEVDKKSLSYMYELLIKIDPEITPSNENCFAFQNYAFNCVSQSNSKKAREARLKFFEDLLLNKKNNYPITDQNDFENDFHEILHFYKFENTDLIKLGDWYLLPTDKI